LGGQQLVERNASGTLRASRRTFDDCITEPHVRRYYAWLLQYGEDDEKGEFVIDARGSTALVERDLDKNEIGEVLKASLNPAFGLDPEKTMESTCGPRRSGPKDFQLSEEQKKQRAAAAQQQQPQDASMQTATIRSQADLQKAGLTQQSDMAELKFKADEAEKQRQHEAR
jgi:hypothetical protein